MTEIKATDMLKIEDAALEEGKDSIVITISHMQNILFSETYKEQIKHFALDGSGVDINIIEENIPIGRLKRIITALEGALILNKHYLARRQDGKIWRFLIENEERKR